MTSGEDVKSGLPVCKVLSRVPKKVLKVVGDTDEDAGAITACIFLDVRLPVWKF